MFSRHSFPFTSEKRGQIDYLAVYDNFDGLRLLKQLPFDQADYASLLSPVLPSLEQFAPPPLALPRWWSRDMTMKGVYAPTPRSEATPITGESNSSLCLSSGNGIRSSESLPDMTYIHVQEEDVPAKPSDTSPPEIPLKSYKRALHTLPPSHMLEHEGGPVPEVSSYDERSADPSDPETESTGMQHRRQLMPTFVRGKRLPFAIAEEDEEATSSESCYSTEDAPPTSDTSMDNGSVLPQRIQTTPSIAESEKHNPTPIKERSNRGQFIKKRMKRIVSVKGLTNRVRGHLA